MASGMGTGHQKDQDMIRSLEVSAPPSIHKRGEECEMELLDAHAYLLNVYKNANSVGFEYLPGG